MHVYNSSGKNINKILKYYTTHFINDKTVVIRANEMMNY